MWWCDDPCAGIFSVICKIIRYIYGFPPDSAWSLLRWITISVYIIFWVPPASEPISVGLLKPLYFKKWDSWNRPESYDFVAPNHIFPRRYAFVTESARSTRCVTNSARVVSDHINFNFRWMCCSLLTFFILLCGDWSQVIVYDRNLSPWNTEHRTCMSV